MDDFLEHLHELPSDLRNIKPHKDEDYMPPTEEYSEIFSETSTSIIPSQPKNSTSAALEKAASANQVISSGISSLKTKMNRVEMEDYVAEQSKRLATLAIEAVEGIQSDVINTADGKLAQAYATLIGTASKALDTVNTIAQEHSRREHDLEMEEVKFQHKKELMNEAPAQDGPKSVTNNVIMGTREDIFRMLMNQPEKNVTDQVIVKQ